MLQKKTFNFRLIWNFISLMYKFQLKEPLPTKYTTKNIFLMFPLIFYYFNRTSVDVHNYSKSLVTITCFLASFFHLCWYRHKSKFKNDLKLTVIIKYSHGNITLKQCVSYTAPAEEIIPKKRTFSVNFHMPFLLLADQEVSATAIFQLFLQHITKS